MKIIPAIDLQGGKCVRLLKGDFQKSTEYNDDPALVARQFAELGTPDLHIVDLDGARSGTQQNRAVIESITETSGMAIQLGGGIRDRDTLQRWFDAGIARCIVGSLVVTDPDVVRSWLVRFGADRIVLALDVDLDEGDVPLITTHGWTRPSNTSVFECIEQFLDIGLQHVLCTDVSRDGALTGPNIDLYATLVTRFPDLRLQASGGVRDIADLEALRDAGVPAAISGRALLDGRISATEVRAFPQSA